MNKHGIAALALLAAVSLSVEAGHRHSRHWTPHHGHGQAYGGHSDRRPSSTTEYADVMSVRPLYRTVRIEQPRRECWDEQVVYRDQRNDRSNSLAASTIVGAIIGGVTGHQFGKGRGRDAATAVGAVVGAGLGQKVALRRQAAYPATEHVGHEEVCRTVSSYRTEERVYSYEVEYRYGGRSYRTTMREPPGHRIPVNVAVSPASKRY